MFCAVCLPCALNSIVVHWNIDVFVNKIGLTVQDSATHQIDLIGGWLGMISNAIFYINTIFQDLQKAVISIFSCKEHMV